MADTRTVKLRDQSGQYRCHVTGWRIKLTQEKPLPDFISDLTRQWLNAGGLVYCEPNQSSTVVEAVEDVLPETVEPVKEEPGREDEPVEVDEAALIKELVMSNDIDTLRKMCFDKGIKFDKRFSAKGLAKLILESE